VSRADRAKRLAALEQRAQEGPTPDRAAAEVEQWCARALGCAFDDLDAEDFARVEQLLAEAPGFAQPLDELAITYPSLEVPAEVIWAVLGWAEHHRRRRHRTRSDQQCA
jgi:hypothetical protein